jgi:heme oxygenase
MTTDTELRDAIHDEHRAAERHRFVSLLLSDRLPPAAWADYLSNQLTAYSAVERLASAARSDGAGRDDGLLPSDLTTAARVSEDLAAVAAAGHPPSHGTLPPTEMLLDRLSLLDPPSLVFAHVYARHLGDAYGGRLIAPHVPGPTARLYEVDDRDAHVARLRAAVSHHLDASGRGAFQAEARAAVASVHDLFEAVCLAHGL